MLVSIHASNAMEPRFLSHIRESVASSIVQNPHGFSNRKILDKFRLESLLGLVNATNISKTPRHAYIKPSSIGVNSKRGEKTNQVSHMMHLPMLRLQLEDIFNVDEENSSKQVKKRTHKDLDTIEEN